MNNMADLSIALKPSVSKVTMVDWVTWLSLPGLVILSAATYLVVRLGNQGSISSGTC